MNGGRRCTGYPTKRKYGDGMNRKPGPTAAEGRRRLNQHLPAELIAGAEEDSCRRLGRGLAPEELERVLRRYPGDP